MWNTHEGDKAPKEIPSYGKEMPCFRALLTNNWSIPTCLVVERHRKALINLQVISTLKRTNLYFLMYEQTIKIEVSAFEVRSIQTVSPRAVLVQEKYPLMSCGPFAEHCVIKVWKVIVEFWIIKYILHQPSCLMRMSCREPSCHVLWSCVVHIFMALKALYTAIHLKLDEVDFS